MPSSSPIPLHLLNSLFYLIETFMPVCFPDHLFLALCILSILDYEIWLMHSPLCYILPCYIHSHKAIFLIPRQSSAPWKPSTACEITLFKSVVKLASFSSYRLSYLETFWLVCMHCLIVPPVHSWYVAICPLSWNLSESLLLTTHLQDLVLFPQLSFCLFLCSVYLFYSPFY